ncbi:hypothetical protein, partial [Thermus scotoductus]|uniref:hypothetical protein n=1 Tax=Thermus scotoductus TaxID=37636 RepID=UPI003F513731
GYRFPHCFPQDHLEGILIHGVPPLPLVPPFIHIPLHIIPYTTQEGRWAERKLKGFSEVKEVLEKMLQERYAPRTQTLTHNS